MDKKKPASTILCVISLFCPVLAFINAPTGLGMFIFGGIGHLDKSASMIFLAIGIFGLLAMIAGPILSVIAVVLDRKNVFAIICLVVHGFLALIVLFIGLLVMMAGSKAAVDYAAKYSDPVPVPTYVAYEDTPFYGDIQESVNSHGFDSVIVQDVSRATYDCYIVGIDLYVSYDVSSEKIDEINAFLKELRDISARQDTKLEFSVYLYCFDPDTTEGFNYQTNSFYFDGDSADDQIEVGQYIDKTINENPVHTRDEMPKNPGQTDNYMIVVF